MAEGTILTLAGMIGSLLVGLVVVTWRLGTKVARFTDAQMRLTKRVRRLEFRDRNRVAFCAARHPTEAIAAMQKKQVA